MRMIKCDRCDYLGENDSEFTTLYLQAKEQSTGVAQVRIISSPPSPLVGSGDLCKFCTTDIKNDSKGVFLDESAKEDLRDRHNPTGKN